MMDIEIYMESRLIALALIVLSVVALVLLIRWIVSWVTG